MLTLYRLACPLDEVARLGATVRSTVSEIGSFLGIQQGHRAPAIHLDRDERVLGLMRWGLATGDPDRLITAVRSPDVEGARCLLPFTAFSLYPAPVAGSTAKLRPVRFSLGPEPPVGFMAGIARHGGYAIVMTTANAEVKAIGAAVMPVVLTAPEQRENWLRASAEDAALLVRPLPDGALTGTPARK